MPSVASSPCVASGYPSPFEGRPHFQKFGIDSWLTEPAGMVNVYSGVVDVEHAAHVSGTVARHMRIAFENATDFCFVHDFSNAATSSEFRRRMTDWGFEEHRAHRVRTVYVVSPSMNRLFLMGIQTAMMSLRLVGMRIELRSSLRAIVAELGLRPAHRST